MGAREESTPTKHSKWTSSVQVVADSMIEGGNSPSFQKNYSPMTNKKEAPATPSYPDWSSSMQAYYGAGAAPAFYASTVASPTPHPYLWGGQHPLMPPYGTPVPYPALYPPGGVYSHPSMARDPSIAPTTGESEGNAPDGKDRTPTKKSKGTSGNTSFIGGKAGESEKAASTSGNDGGTQSAESGSDGSSDANDENTNNDFAASKKGSFHKMLADGASAQNNTTGANIQTSVPVPATNLNIVMDLWNASPAGTGSLKVRQNPSGAVAPGTMIARDGMMPDQWVHDERELKRQKRKQSNRESARRSRLRKQAECEELQGRIEALNDENRTLRDELQRLSKECEKITSENNSIKEELTRRPDEISKLDIQSRGDTGNR